jgi:predicted dehydrogenase
MIRIGVIGVGYWGPNLVRTLREVDGAQVVSVADVRPGRREFIEKRFPEVLTTPDASAVIADSSLDAVFISSPPETHCELALAAIRAGKHVFVEKPLATNVADASRMVEETERAGRTLAVGHLFLYHPAIMMIRKMIDEGEMGEVYFLSSTRANLGPPNARVNVLWDLAPHDVSIVLHLMKETPASVTARGASFTAAKLIETAYVNLEFPSGRMAQINVSWLTPNKTRRLEVVCSNKAAIYDEMHPAQKLQFFEAGVDNRVNASEKDAHALGYGPGSVWSPALASIEPLRAECEDFIHCIATGGTPLSDGMQGLETVRVLQAASESIRTARPLSMAAAR